MKRILAAIVHNEAGVLSRVTSVLNRRQVNIESISVGTTEQPEFSRMTIIINAENPLETEQVTKQLNKQSSGQGVIPYRWYSPRAARHDSV